MQKLSVQATALAKIVWVAALMAMSVPEAFAITVSSTFDTDDEGWLAYGDAVTITPAYSATNGNPGGTIQVTDQVLGGVWYYLAPDKFLNDKSMAYNQALSFDLWQSGSGSQFESSDVVLQGDGLTLTISAGDNPLPLGSWLHYSVVLKEGVGWQKVTAITSLSGTDATQAEVQAVLANLSALYIRGEFITGSDTGRLDNVVMSLVPIPPAMLLFGSGLLGLVGVARRKKAA